MDNLERCYKQCSVLCGFWYKINVTFVFLVAKQSDICVELNPFNNIYVEVNARNYPRQVLFNLAEWSQRKLSRRMDTCTTGNWYHSVAKAYIEHFVKMTTLRYNVKSDIHIKAMCKCNKMLLHLKISLNAMTKLRRLWHILSLCFRTCLTNTT